jgi:threonine/homoserine/homoserine lactone efflux protein
VLHPLFEGIILGISVSLSLGPALFALLQTSIKHGIKTGLFLVFGIFLSDVIVVFAAFFGASQIITNNDTHVIFGLIGGGILIAFGLFSATRKLQPNDQVEAINEIKVKHRGALPYFFKGFFLNIANPFLWGFWITSVMAISSSYHGNPLAVIFFFSGTLGTILTTDIIKCLLANKIKIANHPYVRLWINRIVGMIFLIFGIFVVINVLWKIPNPWK